MMIIIIALWRIQWLHTKCQYNTSNFYHNNSSHYE